MGFSRNRAVRGAYFSGAGARELWCPVAVRAASFLGACSACRTAGQPGCRPPGCSMLFATIGATRTRTRTHTHARTPFLCAPAILDACTHAPPPPASACCLRTIAPPGGGGVEAAVAWVMDHEKDADIDQPLVVTQVRAGWLSWSYGLPLAPCTSTFGMLAPFPCAGASRCLSQARRGGMQDHVRCTPSPLHLCTRERGPLPSTLWRRARPCALHPLATPPAQASEDASAKLTPEERRKKAQDLIKAAKVGTGWGDGLEWAPGEGSSRVGV